MVSTEVKRRAGGCTGLHAIHSRDKVQAKASAADRREALKSKNGAAAGGSVRDAHKHPPVLKARKRLYGPAIVHPPCHTTKAVQKETSRRNGYKAGRLVRGVPLPEQKLQHLRRRQAFDGGLDHALVSHGEALLQQALVSGLQRLGRGEGEREERESRTQQNIEGRSATSLPDRGGTKT